MERTQIDWAIIICRLQGHGFSLEQIAAEAGACRRTICYWRDGYCEPSYSKGARLLSVFETVVKST
jgi:lambda repressor-like predicted transcriptional regulator